MLRTETESVNGGQRVQERNLTGDNGLVEPFRGEE